MCLPLSGVGDTVQLLSSPSTSSVAYTKYANGLSDRSCGLGASFLRRQGKAWWRRRRVSKFGRQSKAFTLVFACSKPEILVSGVCDTEDKFDKDALEEEPNARRRAQTRATQTLLAKEHPVLPDGKVLEWKLITTKEKPGRGPLCSPWHGSIQETASNTHENHTDTPRNPGTSVV